MNLFYVYTGRSFNDLKLAREAARDGVKGVASGGASSICAGASKYFY